VTFQATNEGWAEDVRIVNGRGGRLSFVPFLSCHSSLHVLLHVCLFARYGRNWDEVIRYVRAQNSDFSEKQLKQAIRLMLFKMHKRGIPLMAKGVFNVFFLVIALHVHVLVCFVVTLYEFVGAFGAEGGT
jgi:hypothetical protein